MLFFLFFESSVFAVLNQTLCVCVIRKETLNLEKLEAQLKACLCRISFSKAKVGIHCRGQRSNWITAAQQSDEMLRNEFCYVAVSLTTLRLR